MLTGAGDFKQSGVPPALRLYQGQILWKQIPQHLPWGQSTGALNAGALPL